MEDRDHGARLRSLFREAAGKGAAERDAWLEAQCADDPALLAELRALLRADARTDGVLRGAVAEAAQELDAGDAADSPPEALGPWRVLRPLGRGGMGTVHLGERADGRWQQQVAIKLVAAAGPSRDLARRFHAERRILGRLRHPGIARLLDGGETPDGTPYLVMEYVEGQPVDRWCDDRRLPIEHRLRLFLKICDAVQHAHQALVIHRDLKPSNILVTAEGEPRLLDFGIAKVLAEEDEGPTEDTRTDLRVMTPRTASPEQIRGDALTTATDVHALGLLLHTLLAGDLPYPADGAGLAEFYRTVLEVEAERPGATLARAGKEAAEGIARDRGTTLPRLQRVLRGDLERILARALRKEPEHRYDTVRALADDVRAHLELRPVAARRNHWRYRTGRFLRRNRTGVLAVSVALVAAASFGSWHTVRIAQERDLAQLERTTAEQVTEFLIEIFDVADPATLPGRTVTADEIVARGARRVRDMTEVPAPIRVRLLEALARVHSELGLYGDALPLLREAVTVAEAAGLDLRRRRRLAFLEGESTGYGGDLAGGIAALREALAAAGAEEAAPADRVEARIDLADLLQRHGEVEAAAEVVDRAVEEALRESEDELLLADALTVRGAIRTTLGDLAGAEEDLRRARALTIRLRGADHWSVPDILHELAGIDFYRGDYATAREKLEAAMEGQRRLLGDDHPAVGRSLGSLASLLWAMEELAGAEAAARESIRVLRMSMEPEHDDVVHAQYTLASILAVRHRFREAEALFEETLALQRAANDRSDPEIGNTLAELADVQIALGRLDEAEASLRESIAVQEASLGREHLWVAITHRQLSALRLLRGDVGGALALSEEALERALPGVDRSHPQLGAIYRAHGRALTAARRLDEAEAAFESAFAIHREAGLTDALARTELALAELRLAAGRMEDAEALAVQAIETLEGLHGPEAPDLGAPLELQARILDARGERERLPAVVRRARAVRAGIFSPEHPLDLRLARLAARIAPGG